MTLKDLIADKKKVDKDILEECFCIACDKRRTISETLAKGISVATKLIEDEIKWLEELSKDSCFMVECNGNEPIYFKENSK